MSSTPSQGITPGAAGSGRSGGTHAVRAAANLYAALAARLGDPVEALLQSIEQLMRDAGSDAARAELTPARDRAAECRALVEQLRAMQRGNVFQRVPVSATQLFSHVSLATADRRQSAGIQWRETIAPDAPRIAGDPFRLQQALHALVDNALDAVESYRGEGCVTLSAEAAPDGRLAITVADDGPGMSAGVAGQARLPFFTTKDGRLGLGLALASAVAAEYDGEFGVRTTLGMGTRVSLLLPNWTGGQVTKVDSPPPAPARTRAALLALNDPDAVEQLASACELVGWQYHVAVTADDAALLASRGGYDAAVVATGMRAGETALAAIVERQRGMKGRVVRIRLPDGPTAPGAIELPDSPEALAVALGLALAGQAGLSW